MQKKFNEYLKKCRKKLLVASSFYVLESCIDYKNIKNKGLIKIRKINKINLSLNFLTDFKDCASSIVLFKQFDTFINLKEYIVRKYKKKHNFFLGLVFQFIFLKKIKNFHIFFFDFFLFYKTKTLIVFFIKKIKFLQTKKN